MWNCACADGVRAPPCNVCGCQALSLSFLQCGEEKPPQESQKAGICEARSAREPPRAVCGDQAAMSERLHLVVCECSARARIPFLLFF